jgi:hypothetical protein
MAKVLWYLPCPIYIYIYIYTKDFVSVNENHFHLLVNVCVYKRKHLHIGQSKYKFPKKIGQSNCKSEWLHCFTLLGGYMCIYTYNSLTLVQTNVG